MFRYPLDAETELRLPETRHAQALFALVDSCRPYLREWLPWVDGNTGVEHSLAFIESVRRQFAAEDGFSAGIWHCGELAGMIGYHRIDHANQATSVGYWLGDRFQGRGIMT